MAVLTMLYALLCGFFALASAHNIQLKAHSRECFHEILHADDKMTVTFQVGDREFGGSGNLDIDFWVSASPRATTTEKLLCKLVWTSCQTLQTRPSIHTTAH